MNMWVVYLRRILSLSCLLLALTACTQNSFVQVIYGSQRSTRAVVVEKGDTLSRIAVLHEVDLAALILINDMSPPFKIYPGQKLRLPPETTHVVKQGETLSRIAAVYGVAPGLLARENRLSQPYLITPGQELRLPLPAMFKTEVAVRQPSAKPVRKPSQPAAGPDAPVRTARPPSRRVERAEGGFQWPVRGKILSRYGWMGKGRFNDGINIAAQRGTPVRAVDDGVVAYAGSELTTLGNLLLIKHDGGWISTYAHNEEVLVQSGQSVKRGQIVARVGSSGKVGRPQLHFQLRRGIRTVDPESYL